MMSKFNLKSCFFKILIFCAIINSIRSENEDERLIKEELVKYFQSIDSDEDHQLTIDELARWIRKIHNIIIEENVNAQWSNIDKEIVEEHTWQDYEMAKRETVSWENYRKRIYDDHFEDHKASGDKRPKEEVENEFNQIVARFEKRWKLADEDGTGYLVKDEFKFYLHPEESNNDTILDAAVQDLKDDLDKDHDGSVSFDEYLEHIKSISSEEERQEPDFEEVNKENYELHLDKNKNGILDLDEIKNWMIPDYEKYKLEASHLMEQADLNRDNELQLEELIEGFDKFYNLLPPKFYATLDPRNPDQQPPPTPQHEPQQQPSSPPPSKHDEF